MSSWMMRVISLLLFPALLLAQSEPLTRGLAAFHRGDYATAEKEFRTALEHGNDQRASAFLALTLAETNRCAAAEPGLSAAVAGADPDLSRLAGLGLAQCYINRSRFDQAATVLSQLKAKFADDPDVLYQSARLYMRAWNDAIYQLYQKNPSSFRVNQISGEVLETQGRYKEAAAEYRKAIEKNPKALNLHFRLGRALLVGSHDPENLASAVKEFEAELALNPSDSIAQYQLAQIFIVQQKQPEAEARLQRALELNPEFPEALIALGKLRVAQKKTEEAIQLLQRAVKLSPRSEAAHYSLMMAYRDSGRADAARREKAELDKLQKPPEGEFTEFLKKLGETPDQKRSPQ